jgi:hypothetical protein
VLLAVSSPDEAAFPFHGRMQLTCPGTTRQHLLGRAETLRDEYLRRFEAQHRSIADLASEFGWGHIRHVTGDGMIAAAGQLIRETGWPGMRL